MPEVVGKMIGTCDICLKDGLELVEEFMPGFWMCAKCSAAIKEYQEANPPKDGIPLVIHFDTDTNANGRDDADAK